MWVKDQFTGVTHTGMLAAALADPFDGVPDIAIPEYFRKRWVIRRDLYVEQVQRQQKIVYLPKKGVSVGVKIRYRGDGDLQNRSQTGRKTVPDE